MIAENYSESNIIVFCSKTSPIMTRAKSHVDKKEFL